MLTTPDTDTPEYATMMLWRKPDMDEVLEAETKAGGANSEKINYKAEVAKTFVEIHRLAKETDKNQAETAQLRTETREILDRLKAMYNVA